MTGEFAEVRFPGLPVGLWARLFAHIETVQRELDILRAGGGAALLEQIDYLDTLDRRLRGVSDPMSIELRRAVDRGETATDLVVSLPVGAAADARTLGGVLAEIDALALQDVPILTVETPADLAVFRRWLFGEIVNQIEEGATPTPWDAFSDTAASAGNGSDPAPDSNGMGGVVEFTGDLDISNASRLQEDIQRSHRNGVTNLTLDLTGVTFIDSVGLSLLVTAHNRLAQEGGSVNLRMPGRLRSLLDMSGLLEVLNATFVD